MVILNHSLIREKEMSKLISGKDALLALANGEEVQSTVGCEWVDISIDQNLSIKSFATGKNDFGGAVFFRLKPRAITLNGVELPEPFKPKVGDIAYFVSEGYEDGYSFTDIFDTSPACFGYWKTEEEIKKVVAALRQVFRGEGFLGNTQLSKLKPSTITLNGIELSPCVSIGICRIKNEVSIQLKDESDADRLYESLAKLFGFRG